MRTKSMNGVITTFGEGASMIDVSSLTSALQLSSFADVIQSLLPIVGVAVLVGFLFYVIRWAIGLFRGI